jgi:cytochrome c
VNYILHSNEKTISTLPLKGNYTPKIPEGDNGKGSIVVRAAYTDKGAPSSVPLTTEATKILRSPQLSPGAADTIYRAEKNLQTMFAVSLNIIPKANGFIGFRQIDFTGVQQIETSAMAFSMMGYVGGTIEIRLDRPDGELLGEVKIESSNPFAGASAANAAQNAGGAKGKPAQAGQAPQPPATKAAATATKAELKGAPKKPAAAGFANPFARPGIKTDIKAISGVHDIYFVFKNDKAVGDQALMSVSNIKFNNTKQP